MTQRIPLLACAALTAVFAFNVTASAAPKYAEGQFYTRVKQVNPPDNPNKIVVQEFFWFGCPHCFRLDPLINAWARKLPKDVVYERVPNNLGNPYGVLDEKAFYVAKLLGIEDKIHTPFFRALHVLDLPLTNTAAIRAFFVKTAGITPEQYNSAAASFAVNSDMRRADQLAMDYGILSVPSIIVGGEYDVHAGLPGYENAKGNEIDHDKIMLKVTSFLIRKIRTERKTQDATNKAHPAKTGA